MALIVGGHTFGNAHGAVIRSTSVPKPRVPSRAQDLGWRTPSHGKGADTSLVAGGRVDHSITRGTTVHRQCSHKMGADDQPRRRQAVEAEGRLGRGHGAGRP